MTICCLKYKQDNQGETLKELQVFTWALVSISVIAVVANKIEPPHMHSTYTHKHDTARRYVALRHATQRLPKDTFVCAVA